jgi:hypothetical protein
MKTVPPVSPRYWVAISAASIFGANMGDFFAHALHLGHVRGIPILALLFAGLIVAERRSSRASEAYYWAVIVVLRTAATNLADFATHDLRLPYPLVIAGLAALLLGLAARTTRQAAGVPAADGCFWATMLTAGTLGTGIGDYSADDLGLGIGVGTLVLGAMLLAVLAFGSRVDWRTPLAYWSGIVAVRSAGTTAGDFLASRHGAGLGLPLSTSFSGLACVAILLVWRSYSAASAAGPRRAKPAQAPAPSSRHTDVAIQADPSD